MVIEEQIELEMMELRGNGEPQFKVTMINGEDVGEDNLILVNLKKTFSYMSGRAYIPIDTSDYHGLLEVYYCKKKKGIFGKEKPVSLKVLMGDRKSNYLQIYMSHMKQPLTYL